MYKPINKVFVVNKYNITNLNEFYKVKSIFLNETTNNQTNRTI